MTFDTLVSAFVTIIVMYDPPGMAAIFLGLTTGMTRGERMQLALRGTVLATAILVVFAIAGSAILKTLGISLEAFRIAGGILLFVIAFEMIFEKRHERHEKSAERAVTQDHISNIAVFPLAIPLIAGPGAISATILLAGTFATPFERMGLIAVLIVAALVLFATLVVSDRVDKLLGTTGRAILTRLLGVLLAALSVQFVVDGLKQSFFA
ncbi:MAG: MarC family transcriptional regulator [Rhizobiales bacterium]|nr:MarC family transcriptional regulator [Hyphomicrobiales bacterium]MBA70756.1 MarC family transcriptional regulator [Hyphomicrobiales bacterium]|tara:strand:+ start:1266 stop:1892 length:627 start_codon:yes stop_codon:yes gene_type:complete